MNIRIIDAYPLDIQHNNISPASLPNPGVDYRSAAMAGQTGAGPLLGLEGILGSIAALNDTARNGISTKFNQLREQNRQLKEQNRELREQSRDRPNESNTDQLVERNIELAEQNRRLKEKNKKQLEKLEKAERDLREIENNGQRLISTRIPLTTDSATTEFKAWCNSVEDWIHIHIMPVITDPAQLERAIKNTPSGSFFSNTLSTDRGLGLAARLDYGSHKVMSSCVFRWLVPAIFGQKYRSLSDSFKTLEQIEQSMEKDQIPLYTRQNWKSESYHALIDSSRYKHQRRLYVVRETNELAHNLRMFAPSGGFVKFTRFIETNIIEPGLRLKEQMMASRQEYEVTYFQVSPSAEDQTGDPQKDFGRPDLEWETYLDVTDNLRPLRPDRVYDPERLQILGAVSPCLYTRTISGDAWLERTPCAKQQRLIALKEHYNDFLERERSQRQQKKQNPPFFTDFVFGPDEYYSG
ncbi:hypothetical protein PG989_002924 [Apiospora arundinis]